MTYFTANGTVEECVESIVKNRPNVKTINLFKPVVNGDGDTFYDNFNFDVSSIPEDLKALQVDRVGEDETKPETLDMFLIKA